MARGLWLAMLAVALLPAAALAGPRLGPIVNLSNDRLTDNEVTLAVNPANPSNLIAGWNEWEEHNGVGYSYSFDGGRTWAPASFLPYVTNRDDEGLPAEGHFQIGGDPVFVFTADGVAWAVVQAFNVTPPFEVEMLALRSTDGGRTWEKPLVVSADREEGESRAENERFPDRQAVAADLALFSPFRGSVYVAWAQSHSLYGPSPVLLSYLRPEARAFSPPVLVSDRPGGFAQNVTPFVGSDGSLYVTFIAYNFQLGQSAIYITRSLDGGRSFGPSHMVAPFADPVDGALSNSKYRVFSFPAGAYAAARERVVLAWNDRFHGISTIWTSTCAPDDLDHCSPPARVTPRSTGEQFFPALSAAPNGRLDLLFYDRSRDPGNRLNFLTYAFSTDAGKSWSTLNVRRTPFDGDAQTTPGGTFFIGDYIAAASTNAAAFLAWTGNGRDSVCNCNQEIFFALVNH